MRGRYGENYDVRKDARKREKRENRVHSRMKITKSYARLSKQFQSGGDSQKRCFVFHVNLKQLIHLQHTNIDDKIEL